MVMNLRVYHDSRCLAHENGPGHPERPERIQAILDRVMQREYGVPLRYASAEPATRDDLELVHTPAYLDELDHSSRRPHTVFDADTGANEHSFLAARVAAGAAIAAVRSVLSGDPEYPFVATRPPGHHAERDHAMGFCLINNAAVAAARAIASGVERVAIVDWDVHHGNGTEHMFADRADVLYASLHQAPHYPGTGRSADIGTGPGAGYTVNLPLAAGSGESEYLRAFDEVILPVLDQYRPELIIVSAGFDVHERDPLAGMLLSGSSFALITRRLRDLAVAHAGGRIVHVLEGGYDLRALADGVDSVLASLAGAWQPPAQPSPGGTAARLADSTIARTKEALAASWSFA
jgi:acetoin utilization deacetylase AcuC-like enzyme